jgi:beta-lactamase regulating signal transducer with metallopeptidase domain/FtsZ-binding cell division protein ZapB
MTDFLLKSGLCMAVLLMVYHLFLEREKMHHFNRFYLLGALVFSFMVPFININTSTPSVANAASVTLEELVIGNPINITEAPAGFDFSSLLLTGYSIISLLLLLRFGRNIFYFIKKVKQSETLDYSDAILVLIEEPVLPHTFLNYILVNKEDHQKKNIERELYTHELTHIRQKHTLDIVFIEILRILLWFNPLLYMYKKAIQLNHEFLADENVVKMHNNITTYQNLLLRKASGAQGFALASNLNFSVTKKRLLMMTKHTSLFQATIKKAAILPLLIGVVFITYSQASDRPETTDFTGRETNNSLTNEENNPGTKMLPKVGEEQASAHLNQHQQTLQDTIKNPVHSANKLTVQPEYPGGLMAFYQYVNKSFKIPESFTGQAKIYLSFVIEKDGSVTNIKVMRTPNEELANEAVRVLSESQKWIPGKIKKETVRTSYNLPITINSVRSKEIPPLPSATRSHTIDPHKMKSIEVIALTQMEINALKELNPEKYTDEALKDYMAVKISYVNDEGELVSETTYEKRPK